MNINCVELNSMQNISQGSCSGTMKCRWNMRVINGSQHVQGLDGVLWHLKVKWKMKNFPRIDLQHIPQIPRNSRFTITAFFNCTHIFPLNTLLHLVLPSMFTTVRLFGFVLGSVFQGPLAYLFYLIECQRSIEPARSDVEI